MTIETKEDPKFGAGVRAVTPNAARIESFADFWPYYLREHARPATRAWHYFGSSLAVLFLLVTLISGNPWWLLALLVAGYGPAWIGHFFIEHNRPATFRHPLWSLIGDWRMVFAWVTGRLGRELAQAGVERS